MSPQRARHGDAIAFALLCSPFVFFAALFVVGTSFNLLGF